MEGFLTRYYPYFLGLLVGALMVLSFLLGRSEGERGRGQEGVLLSCSDDVLTSLSVPIQALAAGTAPSSSTTSPSPSSASRSSVVQGAFVGSKNGTKYYTPGCSGLHRIKPENYIWFTSEEDALLQGYTPAHC